MINLMFIENISRLDLIKFNNENERENYFMNRSEVTIETIYPPHFQNRIQFSIEDLSPSTKVNYLSLLYENKYYYYFIDEINYINEGVYELLITMDTITTFMFDITITEGTLERQCINRWNNEGSINRNYIRENLSNGDFINTFYKKLDNKKNKCLIFKARNEILNPNIITGGSTTCHLQNLIYDNYTELNDGTLYIIIPLIDIDNWIKVQLISYYYNGLGELLTISYELSKTYYSHLINYLVESPYVVDAYICNNNFTNNILKYSGYSTDETTNLKIIQYILASGLDDNVKFIPHELTIHFSDAIGDYKYPILTDIYCKNFSLPNNYIRFGKNINKNSPFSIYHIPQLLDDNYYRINFGEKLGYISYPLYTLKDINFNLKYNFDIMTGNRNMCILEDIDDIYLTVAINQTKESLQLFTDRFQNYMVTNHGTLTTGVALAKANAQWSMGKRLWNSFESNNRGEPLINIGTGLNKAKLASSIGNYAIALGDSFMDYYNIEQQLKISRENAEYSPDILKQGNTFSTDLMSSSLDFFVKIDTVIDLEKVAHKYEQYGYLINKEIHTKYKLYDSIFNVRYYFNIIKFGDVNITLDYIGSNSLIQNIKDRLINGLRLWNIYSSNDYIDYNKFEYDNIEIENIVG